MKTSLRQIFRNLLFPLLLFCVFLLRIQLWAQEVLPTKSVTIFKNGSCMIVKESTLKLQNDTLRLPVPNAINSTYWLNTPKEQRIKSVVFQTETLKTKQEVSTMSQLLKLNIGKNISFVKLQNEKTPNGMVQQIPLTISGKMLGYNIPMDMLKIESKEGVRFLKVNEISDLSIENGIDSQPTDSIVRYAMISPVQSLSEMTVQELSLQSGMQWIPSYYLRLTEDNKASLQMKALIENFSNEDITKAETEVVIGVPQLYFSQVLDPAISVNWTQIASNTGNYWAAGRAKSATDVGVERNVSGEQINHSAGVLVAGSDISIHGGRAENTQPLFDGQYIYDIGADAEESKDNFIYKLGTISLKKQSKAFFPIFATEVEYKDIHECDIPDKVNFENTHYVAGKEESYDVFHSIEIKNNTNYPFTGGGIMVTDENNRFLAQDQLKFTAKGNKGLIHLAKAVNISLKNSEEELARTESVKKIGKVVYNKARIRGSISIENFTDKEVTIKVKKHLNGAVVINGSGKVKKEAQNYSINPQSEITWEISIPPGEKKETVYEYESLFRL